MEHLLPAAREALALPTTERLQWIRTSRWISNPHQVKILAMMQDLVAYPRQHRMPSLLVVGESNSGKTTIGQRFAAQNPFIEHDDGLEAPVVFIEAPSQPDEKRLYASIIDKLYGPMRRWARLDQMEYQVTTLMRETGVKVLVIDELHHIMTGPVLRTKTALQAMKSLSNKLQVSIVAIGLPEAFSAINSDAQLANRFQRVVLERWKPNREFKQLLAAFESALPLRKRSFLTDAALSATILQRTDGLLGEICDLLKRATERAVLTEAECIDKDVLDRCGYVPPADRSVYDRYTDPA